MANKTTDPTLEEELETDEEEVDEETQDETELDDESDNDQEADEETGDESDESDSEDDEDESDEDEESEDFKQRFTQFKGEDLPQYTKKLEDGYLESSKEAVKLAKENKTLQETIDRVNQLVATNPDLAKALQEGTSELTGKPADSTVVRDPAVLWAESEMKRVQKAEYDKFVSVHPEIESDPKLASDLDAKLKVVADVVWNQEKRQIGLGEALETSWKLLGMDDTKEKISMAAKETGSQGKSSGTKKVEKTSTKFTEAQISVAMDMMNVSRSEAIKNLSANVK